MKKQLQWLSSVVVFVSLIGCGGGGAGPTTSTPSVPNNPIVTSVNVAAAVNNLLRAGHSFTLIGTNSQGTSLRVNLSTAAGNQVTDLDISYDTSNITSSAYSDGILLANNVSTIWLIQGTLTPYFTTTTTSQACGKITSTTPLPTQAQIGQSGHYYSATRYTSCISPSSIRAWWGSSGNNTLTWSVQAVEGITYVCLNSSTQDVTTTTESDCVEVIASDGTLGSRARVTTKDWKNVTATLSTS